LSRTRDLPEKEIQDILKIYEDCVKFNQSIKRSMTSRNWKTLYSRQIENAKIRVKWIKQILRGK